MAANTRSKAAAWGTLDVVGATNVETIEANAAAAIRRDSSKSGWRRHPFLPVETIASTGGGTRMCAASYGTLVCVNVNDDLYCNLLELPDAHKLNYVKVHVHPAGAHGAQPAVLFSAHVYKMDDAGTATLLGSATHTWADIATYEAGFDLTTADLNHTIDLETYTYVVKIILESGANSVTAGTLVNMKVYCTLDTAAGGADLSTWLHA